MTAAHRYYPERSNEGQSLHAGRVALAGAEGRYSVALEDGGDVVARKAASCLMVPRPGDRVLVALAPEPYVLAVLERADPSVAAELRVEGSARLEARGGTLELRGDEGVGVSSAKLISLLSRGLSVKSQAVELVGERIDAVAKRALASFDEVGLVARTVDTVAERIMQKAERVYRVVEQLDQLRARHFDYRAEHSAQIKGENTVMVARQVAKIDGEQIHVG